MLSEERTHCADLTGQIELLAATVKSHDVVMDSLRNVTPPPPHPQFHTRSHLKEMTSAADSLRADLNSANELVAVKSARVADLEVPPHPLPPSHAHVDASKSDAKAISKRVEELSEESRDLKQV
jgi:hypothetical protein